MATVQAERSRRLLWPYYSGFRLENQREGQDMERQAVVTLRSAELPGETYKQWFQSDSTPRFIISRTMHVRASNRAADRLVDEGIVHIDPAGCLHLSGPLASCLPKLLSDAEAGSKKASRIVCFRSDLWVGISVLSDPGAGVLFLSLRPAQLMPTCNADNIADLFSISSSERPILDGIAAAICPKDIARQANISIHTVRAHQRSIYAKMGTRTAAETQRVVLQLTLLSEYT